MIIRQLRITNYELRITNYEMIIRQLRITNYELRMIADRCHLDTPAQYFPIGQQHERLLDDRVAVN